MSLDTQTRPTPVIPQAAGPRRYRPDIQGLRAIAVTLVVLYHAGVPGIRGGYVGVDVFFVISGFLITGQLLREVEKNGRVNFFTFYANRLRRLVPPAAVVLLFTLIVARIWGSLFQFRSNALDALFTVGYVFNYRLAALGVDYQNNNGLESPLQHFWSLAVEEQYYVIWPVLITVCAVLARRGRIPVLTGLLVAIVGVSLWYSITVTTSNAPLAYFSLHTRAWELGLGALVSIAATRLSGQPRWVALTGGWVGVLAIIASGLYYTDSTPFPGSAALVPVVATALVIASGCRQTSNSVEVILNRKPMQGIGAVSYSWYLWHWPLLILVPFMFGKAFVWGENLELMVIALWISVLSYWIIENPTRRTQLRRALWTSIGVSLSASVAVVALVLMISLPALVGSGESAFTVSLDHNAARGVATAVGRATTIKEAPVNLTPSLANIALDQPATSHNGCHLDWLEVVEKNACVYGDRNGSRVAVLTGDSHAQQWLPGLDKAARDSGWKIVSWTKAACPLADIPVYSDVLKREFTECVKWRHDDIEKIKLMAPDLVILGQSDGVPGKTIGNIQWAEGTAKTLGEFLKVKIPVAYLADTPYHEQSVPECIARNLKDVGACTVKRKYSTPYAGRSEQMKVTLKEAHIAVIDPTNWFCTAVDCPAVVGNLQVYRDASHVSTAYSYYLAPLFVPLFAK